MTKPEIIAAISEANRVFVHAFIYHEGRGKEGYYFSVDKNYLLANLDCFPDFAIRWSEDRVGGKDLYLN